MKQCCNYDFDFEPVQSDCELEIKLKQFLSALDEHPLYVPDFLPTTYDLSVWDFERKRLVAMLLHEAEKVRQLPANLRDWDFDTLTANC